MSQKGHMMTLKHLESYLQTLEDFDQPKVDLEQYATPPHIAALMLNVINSQYNDIEDKFVADLGCGTGRLSIGSVLCGARMTLGFDVDRDALDGALQNVIDFFADVDDEDGIGDLARAYSTCSDINFIQADLSSFVDSSSPPPWTSTFRNKFDTVIMNPPFGTKHNKGLDIQFLRTAIELAEHVVYSLHKSSTRSVSSPFNQVIIGDAMLNINSQLTKCHPILTSIYQYIQSKCQQWGVNAKPIAQFRYNLDSTYKFHRKKSVDIDVDLWRIEIL